MTRVDRCKVDAGRGAAAAPRLMPGGEGILYSKSVKSLADLKGDDEAAAAEQAAQGGKLRSNQHDGSITKSSLCQKLAWALHPLVMHD